MRVIPEHLDLIIVAVSKLMVDQYANIPNIQREICFH